MWWGGTALPRRMLISRLLLMKAIMVVLVGSSHVAYGVGIARQAAKWFDGRVTTFIPLPIRDIDNRPLPTVKASYADFILGIPASSSRSIHRWECRPARRMVADR